MTPFELNIYIEEYAKRTNVEAIERYNLCVIQAQLIRQFVWAKTIDVNKYLHNEKEKKEMTDGEMLAQVRALNAALGGSVKTEKR